MLSIRVLPNPQKSTKMVVNRQQVRSALFLLWVQSRLNGGHLMSAISANTQGTSGYIFFGSANANPHQDLNSEARDLKKDGLIGEDSLIAFGSSQSLISYWSEKEHSQFQAYKQENTSASQQAAAYHQQMIAERQALVTDYLANVLEASTSFNQLNLPKDITFHQVLDNTQAGLDVDHNISPEHSEIIQQFWQDNKAKLEQLDEQYSNLQAFPRDLESWLDQRNETVSDEVFEVVDRLKNAWASIGKVEVGSDYRPNSIQIHSGDEQGKAEAIIIETPENDLSLIRSVEQITLKSAQYSYTSDAPGADKSRLVNFAGQEYLSQELSRTYNEMQVIIKDLFSQFTQQFSTDNGYGDFSLQDIIDNYISNKPLAQLDDGTIHPLEQDINDFWQEHRHALEQYSSKQRRLYELPENFADYLTQNKAAIEQYLTANLDRFLNLDIALDR